MSMSRSRLYEDEYVEIHIYLYLRSFLFQITFYHRLLYITLETASEFVW